MRPFKPGRRPLDLSRERGVVLVITLIALAILTIGGIALVRSFDTSMLMSGNLAFKRDLMNQGERAMAQAIDSLRTGALASEATRQADSTANNYSASLLASDANGVPNVLIGAAAWGFTGADITDATSGVTIRYVIDRQCAGAGAFDTGRCMYTTATADKGGSALSKTKAGAGSRPVYRISVRVTGPRNTQAYLQSTVTM